MASTRIRKAQVSNQINKLNDDYGTDLRKEYSTRYMCYRWSISKAYSQRVELGDTLADCMETLDAMIGENQWREQQQAEWEAEQS